MDHPNESGKAKSPTPTSSPSPSSGGSRPELTTSSNWTLNNSETKTVKVTNVAPAVSETDIYDFFSFSGEILYIEIQSSESETSKVAFVTFQEPKGADTAALLTGAMISGLAVSVTLCKDYQLPPNAVPLTSTKTTTTSSAVNKAEDVVSTMLAKGFVLGKDALNKAKAFDEKHGLMSNATATVASLDRKMGLSRKLSMGKTVMNEKVKEMDEKYQVSEKTKSALAAAEQKASTAGSAIMSNRYVFTSALWVTSALTAVSKAAEEVTAKAMEKVEKAEEEKKESFDKDMVNETKITGDATTKVDGDANGNESPTIPVISADNIVTNKKA